MPEKSNGFSEPAFVSHQVSESRRYYLSLKPSPRAALSVVCGGMEKMRPEYVVERQDFPFFAVEFVAEGKGTLELIGRRYPLTPGSVFAYGPGVAHTIRNDPRAPMRKYYVDFAGTEAKGLIERSVLGKWNPMFITDIPSMVDAFESLAREAKGTEPLTGSLCEMRLLILLLKIEQLSAACSRDVPRAFATYEKVRAHIEAHFLRLHTVAEIAQECHVSPVHIAKLFRRFSRTGAYHYLMKLKMSRAAELLIDHELLVKEAAARLGFPDAFQFSKAFKRIYGVAPAHLVASRWRQDRV